jgi:pimeloyl-ACP methyl ester carboxylesterase
MGPGFHARIEKEKFSSLYPHVLFPDQPSRASFHDLVQWSLQEIKNLHQKTGAPIALLGHSFGAHILAEAAPQVPEMIAEVRILNSAYDPFQSFIHLEEYLLGAQARGGSHWQAQSPAEKMNLIFTLAPHPGLADSYWRDPAKRQAYEALAAHHPALDVESFVAAFSDFLVRQKDLKKKTWDGPTRIFYSPEDHLIRDFATVAAWKNLFPRSQFATLTGGHHALFEIETLPVNFFAEIS